jgi:hypothetical protein
MQNITKYFTKAKLPLTVTNRPIGNLRDNADKIFQMTIDPGKTERFRIFKGQGNDVRVLDVDSKKEQVLLFVKEPKRIFKEVRYDPKLHKDVETTSETPDYIRRYLMGMDERRLFISELPDRQGKINTVEDAHRILKPYEVKDRKKRKKIKILRQGEWFFTEASPAELLLINESLKLVESKQPIVLSSTIRSRKPHIAEQILKIDDKVFVKGRIRHEDHKTKEFFVWHRVFMNTEKIDNPASRVSNWID